MKTSVIIPTYEGANKIINIIQALERQTFKDFETLIMIDGSQDNTKEVIEKYKHNLQNLRVIYQENQGRAGVRNSGLNLANGELLIFFDDDMRPLANSIEEHVLFHQQHHNCIVVGGLNEDLTLARTDIQKYKAFLSEKWIRELREWKKPLNINNLYLTGANFSISHKIIEQLNGFDERLSDVEDWDLAVRAFDNDIPIYYHHKAFAWHDDFITFASYIKRQSEYKSAYQLLLSLKPELYKKFALRRVSVPTGIKALIYKLIYIKFFIWSIDFFNWLMIFPKRFRYRIYDLVISAHLFRI